MTDQFKIERYTSEHCDNILSAIGKAPEWEFLICSESKRNNYVDRLENSATFVCYSGKTLCGYIRAIIDDGLAIYVSELFVKPEFRNRNIGQKLIEQVKADNASVTVYALSDEDRFYKKKGYRKIGSVFEI